MSKRRLFLNTVPLTLFVLLFGLSAILSASITYDPKLVGDSLNAVWISIAGYFAVAYLIQSRSIARYTVLIFMEIAGGVALLFIGQFHYQDYPEMADTIRRLGNATTFLPDLSLGYLHPNAVATFLEAVLPLAVAFSFTRRTLAVRATGAVTALILLYAIFLTYSRGAYIGLAGAVGVLLFVLILYRLPRPAAYAALFLALIAAIAAVFALYHLDPAQPLLGRPVDPRLTLYHNSLYLARDYAFTGIGLGNTFAALYSRYSLLIQPFYVSDPSDLLLAVWLNQGLLGLISFVGMMAAFYVYVIRIMRRVQPSLMFHGAWLGVTATLLHGLFDARQYTESPWVMPVLFIVMGFAVAYGQVALRDEGIHLSLSRWMCGASLYAAASLTLLVVFFLIFRPSLTAAWYTNQGALDETRADFAPNLPDSQRRSLADSAVTWYKQALDAIPDYAPANRRLGNFDVARDSYEEAVPLLERAYASEPTNPAAIKGLGLAYVWVGRTEDAARLLKRLPNPDDMANELYTWGYYRSSDEQHKPLLAAYAWETAEFMGDAGNIDVWMNIADLYRQASAPDRAQAAYQHILDIDPNYRPARDALAAFGA